jgi:hypothetical protein
MASVFSSLDVPYLLQRPAGFVQGTSPLTPLSLPLRQVHCRCPASGMQQQHRSYSGPRAAVALPLLPWQQYSSGPSQASDSDARHSRTLEDAPRPVSHGACAAISPIHL